MTSSSSMDTHTKEERADHPTDGVRKDHGSESQLMHADPTSDDFTHGFWDRDLAALRKFYLMGLVKFTILVSVLIWAIVTMYWGSLWKSSDRSPNISAFVINRDTGAIGTNLTNAFLSTNDLPPPHLTWTSVAASRYPTSDDVVQAVAVDEDAWIMVEIVEDATAQLETARNNADASWDPTSVVKVYYSEARNQVSVDGVILSSTRGILTSALTQINKQSTAQYLAANAANAAALIAIANDSPQTIAGPVAVSYLNLRPWANSVAIAPTFVGLIYVLVIAFNITMANQAFRQGIQRKLRLRSLILMRLLAPLVTYFFLSCMFSLINVPFKLPFGGMGLTSNPYGAGFMIWWMFTFLGMSVLGLFTEAALSLVGPSFIGFALLFLIIINVSVANLPIELQVDFFQYGYAMPFYNLRQAYIAIIYNVGKHSTLFKYFGILLSWLVVVLLTLPIWIWRERRQALKDARPS
ncbi:hypothetical protein CBS101457_005303 [Exobasidium rhododendri]|nr:hypothetical protein CBS101457_005303 [Exobasidium rhododendri]